MKKNKSTIMILLLAAIAIILAGLLLTSYLGEQQAAAAREMLNKQISEGQLIIKERQGILDKADRLLAGYYYDEAIAELASAPALPEVTSEAALALNIEPVSESAFRGKATLIQQAKASLVVYSGPTHHIFFHSLIVYPQLAFDDKGRPKEGYNYWMVTVSEFKKMLPQLREKGYVLYNLSDYSEPDPDHPGQIRAKEIMLPPGKKPLVISVDDVNYYDYMKTDGFANKLVAGSDGKIYTEVTDPEGNVSITRDGDVMPILDDFVVQHPDFSWRGAKGTLALTGYEGALGYRISTLPEGAELEKAKEEAKAAADVLKKNGWLFASHSFTHNGYFKDYSITMKQLIYDTEKWRRYMEPIIGKTNLYITPFGVRFKSDDPRLRYLVDEGFTVICPVGSVSRIIYNKDNMVMSRADIDGFAMHLRPQEITKYYFNVDEILDPGRPGF